MAEQSFVHRLDPVDRALVCGPPHGPSAAWSALARETGWRALLAFFERHLRPAEALTLHRKASPISDYRRTARRREPWWWGGVHSPEAGSPSRAALTSFAAARAN